MKHPKAIVPQPGQESVWDYPRPPRLEACSKELVVIFNGQEVARTRRGYRVLETSHPPGYYFPPEDVEAEFLRPSALQTGCEWKGKGSYFHLEVDGRRSENAAWAYHAPFPAFAAIAGYISFYPGRTERCTVNGETVIPQPGEFYGGWITADVVGPFKGVEGSWGW